MLIKNGKFLNNKKDMRKKVIKSSFPTMTNDKIYKKDFGGILDNIANIDLAEFNKVNPSVSMEAEDPFSVFSIPEIIERKQGAESQENNEETYDINNFLDHKLFRTNFDILTAKDWQQIFKEHNVHANITSAYRPGAKTKSGHISFHATGQAIDIVPEKGYSFDQLKKELLSIQNILDRYGVGVLDETTKSNQAKYGSTGAHYHIGPDTGAINNWNSWKKTMFAKYGTSLLKAQEGAKLLSSLPKLADFSAVISNIPKEISDITDYLVTPEVSTKPEEIEVDTSNTNPVIAEKPKIENTLNVTDVPKGMKNFYNALKPVLLKALEIKKLPTDNLVDMIAQLGEETGWGKSIIGNYNLGNIKAFNNRIYSANAYRKGTKATSTRYVNYSDLYDFALNYLDLLKASRYKNPFVGEFAAKLKAGGYAEDPGYVAKVNAAKNMILKNIKLFDV